MSHILIVEDDFASGDILTKRLQHKGYDVTLVENGEKAQRMLTLHPYELIIIDLALPGLDGWDLLKWIQGQPPFKAVKTVAFTAYYDPQVALRAKTAGFLECFPKPATQRMVDDLQQFIDTRPI